MVVPMGFKMNFNKEDISGKPPMPNGWYTIQFKGFKPKVVGENKDSINLQPELSVVGNQEHENRRVFHNLNTKAGWIMNDFHHGFGVPMEVVQDGNQGTEAENYTLAGTFENIDKFPDDPSQWGKYIGPLLNKTAQVELAVTEFQGRQRNEIRQFKCSVSGCQEKHSTNLTGGK